MKLLAPNSGPIPNFKLKFLYYYWSVSSQIWRIWCLFFGLCALSFKYCLNLMAEKIWSWGCPKFWLCILTLQATQKYSVGSIYFLRDPLSDFDDLLWLLLTLQYLGYEVFHFNSLFVPVSTIRILPASISLYK